MDRVGRTVVADRAVAARAAAEAGGKGRPRVPDRQALRGILFVLPTGIQREYLPKELGFGSGMTYWRRLAAWNEAGVGDQVHKLLLNTLRSKNQLDWSRAVIDSSRIGAARMGPKADPVRPTAHTRAASTTSPPMARADRPKPQRHHTTAAAG